jgi:hypothetical protein
MKINNYFSGQAKISAIGYFILFVVMLLNKSIILKDKILNIVLMLFPMIVSVFVINCLVVGTTNGGLPCGMIAWINSVSILICSIIILLFVIIYKKDNKENFHGHESHKKEHFGPHENKKEHFGAHKNKREHFGPHKNKKEHFGPHENKKEHFGAHENKKEHFGAHENKKEHFGAHENKKEHFGAHENKKEHFGAHENKKEHFGSCGAREHSSNQKKSE